MLFEHEMQALGGGFHGVRVDREIDEQVGEIAEIELADGIHDPAQDLDTVIDRNVELDSVVVARPGERGEAHLVQRETEVIRGITIEARTGRRVQRRQPRGAQAANIGRKIERESSMHGR